MVASVPGSAPRLMRGLSRACAGLNFLVMIIVAPLVATLIQLAISRSREHEADHTGAGITGNPMDLERAIDKLDK
jgi:heat shock protein HtpX